MQLIEWRAIFRWMGDPRGSNEHLEPNYDGTEAALTHPLPRANRPAPDRSPGIDRRVAPDCAASLATRCLIVFTRHWLWSSSALRLDWGLVSWQDTAMRMRSVRFGGSCGCSSLSHMASSPSPTGRTHRPVSMPSSTLRCWASACLYRPSLHLRADCRLERLRAGGSCLVGNLNVLGIATMDQLVAGGLRWRIALRLLRVRRPSSPHLFVTFAPLPPLFFLLSMSCS